jgi:hypothetical protein
MFPKPISSKLWIEMHHHDDLCNVDGVINMSPKEHVGLKVFDVWYWISPSFTKSKWNEVVWLTIWVMGCGRSGFGGASRCRPYGPIRSRQQLEQTIKQWLFVFSCSFFALFIDIKASLLWISWFVISSNDIHMALWKRYHATFCSFHILHDRNPMKFSYNSRRLYV